jgi:hypothetical protein
MTKEHSSYRHPRHDEIARLIRAGHSDSAVYVRTGVNRTSVARVRRIIGYVAYDPSTSKEDKLARFTTPPDRDGHMYWTGRTNSSGSFVIRHRGKPMVATHVAFEQRTGRRPEGVVKAECGDIRCVNPDHLADGRERQTIRQQMRILSGLPPQPWDTCPAGLHSWDEGGRIQGDLTPFCQRCNTERSAEQRKARREEVTTA